MPLHTPTHDATETQPATTPAPAQQLDHQSLDCTWPQELKAWWYALQGAEEAYTNIDDLECQAARDRDPSRDQLRRIATLALQLKHEINAAGTAVLAYWDEDDCSWRKTPRW